jgi:hypothetical protein
MANANNALDNTTIGIANEIWSALADAAVIEAPLSVKPFYDEVLKNEDKTDYKKPSELLLDEYQAVAPKTNWNFNVKYSLFSINMAAADKPIRLCHLLLYVAYKLKVFGEDAFGKVTARCKTAAAIVNYLLERNRVFFPVGSGRNRIPTRVRAMNEEIFKTTILDFLKCCVDTNLQWYYVGDGVGDVATAGLGLPPMALTDGSLPGAEILFRRSLHEVKGLVESKVYLKNPESAEAAAERHQSAVLDAMNNVLAGRVARSDSTDVPVVIVEGDGTNNNVTNVTNDTDTNLRMSPLSRDSVMDDGGSSKRRSPAATMAEASLLAQKAAMEEAKNAAEMIAFQREDLKMRAEELKAIREERITEAKASRLERKTTAKVLQKIVEKLCPEEDPTDKFTARKRKLDEARAALGEELYHMKVQQLKDEFMKTSAM